jgi:hypothetical protein
VPNVAALAGIPIAVDDGALREVGLRFGQLEPEFLKEPVPGSPSLDRHGLRISCDVQSKSAFVSEGRDRGPPIDQRIDGRIEVSTTFDVLAPNEELEPPTRRRNRCDGFAIAERRARAPSTVRMESRFPSRFMIS